MTRAQLWQAHYEDSIWCMWRRDASSHQLVDNDRRPPRCTNRRFCLANIFRTAEYFGKANFVAIFAHSRMMWILLGILNGPEHVYMSAVWVLLLLFVRVVSTMYKWACDADCQRFSLPCVIFSLQLTIALELRFAFDCCWPRLDHDPNHNHKNSHAIWPFWLSCAVLCICDAVVSFW